jgi:NTP pyrophosphatase (non-canonical NTP hydrolase)
VINYKKKLIEFHRKFFNKTGDWRNDVNQKFLKNNPTAILRAELIQEEARELIEELRTGTLETVRKELCDLLYVTFGTAAVYNLPVDEDFMKVHQNNMLKFDTGVLRADGKLVKAKDHPAVVFNDVTELQYELLDYRIKHGYE